MNDLSPIKPRPLYQISTDRMTLEVQGPEHAGMISEVLDNAHSKFLYGHGEGWRAPQIIHAGLEHWLRHGFGPMVMRDKQSSAWLGVVTLWKEYDLDEIELGGFLRADQQGKGYAIESQKALRKIAKTHYKIRSLIGRVDGKNAPAIKLMRKLGAVYECDREYRYFGPMQVWRHYTLLQE